MDVLIYGLQRSGTNFLEALLKRYRVRVLNDQENRGSPRHKHFRLYADKTKIPEPQYANDVTPRHFQDLERVAPADLYLIISKDPYSWLLSYRKWARKCSWPPPTHHYAEEWGLFHGAWIALSEQAPERIRFLRYVDLLSNPYLDLPRRHLYWPQRIAQVAQSGSFDASRARYYIEERYLEEIDTAEVNSRIPRDVIERTGYRVC